MNCPAFPGKYDGGWEREAESVCSNDFVSGPTVGGTSVHSLHPASEARSDIMIQNTITKLQNTYIHGI